MKRVRWTGVVWFCLTLVPVGTDAQTRWTSKTETNKLTDVAELTVAATANGDKNQNTYELVMRCDGHARETTINTFTPTGAPHQILWPTKFSQTVGSGREYDAIRTQTEDVGLRPHTPGAGVSQSMDIAIRVDIAPATTVRVIPWQFSNSLAFDLPRLPSKRLIIGGVFPDETVEFSFTEFTVQQRTDVLHWCFEAERVQGQKDAEQAVPDFLVAFRNGLKVGDVVDLDKQPGVDAWWGTARVIKLYDFGMVDVEIVVNARLVSGRAYVERQALFPLGWGKAHIGPGTAGYSEFQQLMAAGSAAFDAARARPRAIKDAQAKAAELKAALKQQCRAVSPLPAEFASYQVHIGDKWKPLTSVWPQVQCASEEAVRRVLGEPDVSTTPEGLTVWQFEVRAGGLLKGYRSATIVFYVLDGVVAYPF